MSLDSIIDISISTQTTSVARAGFGVPLLAAYFPTSIFPERVRLYSSLAQMVSDGFPVTHPAYLMAQRLKSQKRSVRTWKVGRRALPMSQTLRLTPTLTTEGEVLRLTVEGTEIAYTIPASATVGSICTALEALLEAVVGVAASDDTTHVTITPNRVNSIRLTVDTADNSQDFTVTINGEDFVYPSDTNATVTEIRDGLKALIDASDQNVSTANVSTDALDITCTDEAGFEIYEEAGGSGAMSFSASVSNYDLLAVGGLSTGLTIKDNTTDPGLATDLAAMEAEDADWYCLLLDSESGAQISAGAAFIEARKKIFIASTIDSEVADAVVTTDIGSTLKAAAYARTALIFAAYNQQYAGAGWAGILLPKDPGSATWAYKTMAGVTVSTLTAAQAAALDGKRVNHYQLVGGVNVTQKGYSASGEFLDITRGSDWMAARLQERYFSLLVNNDKVDFDDSTGDLIRAQILAQFEEGLSKRVLRPNTEEFPWVINIPAVADISLADRIDRLWAGSEFSAYLAGAVHNLQLAGTLTP